MPKVSDFKSRRYNPNPRTIKKHSDIINKWNTQATVAGDKELTNTGHKIPGFNGEYFCTLYQVMMSNTCTDTVRSPDKDRVIRCFTGKGLVVRKLDNENSYHEILLAPGDEAVLPAKCSYRLSTFDVDFGFMVVESPNYTDNIEVVDRTGVGLNVPRSEITSSQSSEEYVYPQIKRRGSRAAEQQMMIEAKRGNNRDLGSYKVGKAEPSSASVVEGVNPVPSHGNFDSGGAG